MNDGLKPRETLTYGSADIRALTVSDESIGHIVAMLDSLHFTIAFWTKVQSVKQSSNKNQLLRNCLDC